MTLKDLNQTSSKSDKISHHGYHRFYSRFLDDLREHPIQMLEIGIDREESMKLWSEYFPKATIHGADIKKYPSSERITMHHLDQSNSDQLSEFADQFTESFDFILDDGSHVPKHQILTLEQLWKCLKPGGIFIIEDIETNYWGKSVIYGYAFDSNRYNLLAYLSSAVDHINSEFSGLASPKHPVFADLESMTFGHNCIVLEKKSPRYEQFYSRPYRFGYLQNCRTLFKRAHHAYKRL
ncbi:MAG: class I SAM-dependent methyltransferase, partial [Flavobacteriales bacterium]